MYAIKIVESLFRTFNNNIFDIIDYIETRQTVRSIFEKYLISEANINLINNIVVCILDFLIMIIAICLTSRIISTIINIVKWIFHSDCSNDTNENNSKNKRKNCKKIKRKKKVVYRKPVFKGAKKIKIPHFRKKSKRSQVTTKLFNRKKVHNNEVSNGNVSAKRCEQNSQQYNYNDSIENLANQKNSQISTNELQYNDEETCYTDTIELNAEQIRQQVQQQKKS